MGKNPTEAKKNRDQRTDKTKNVLYYWYYKKPNGALGLKKEFRVTEVTQLTSMTANK